MVASTALHRRSGTMASGPFSVSLTPADAGWTYTSLRVVDLAAGASVDIETGDDELLVLPLGGSCTVAVDGERFELSGRPGVFAGVSDFAYVPRDARVTVASSSGGRFALPGARADRRLPPRYQPAAATPVELRGAGACSRQVVNYCTPATFEADRLMVVEAYTPAGNWATFPPHKHDTVRPGETALEEIYVFEIAGDGAGVAYQRMRSADERPLDLLAEVRSGDVVLVPYGWHGPTMALPGYDASWINVMAGPAREWKVCEEPDHRWVRDTWSSEAIDPRLPLPGFEANASTVDTEWGR